MNHHIFNLSSEPFIDIAEGRKIIESRLYDEKRRNIKEGDVIVFVNRDDNRQILVRVSELVHADSFSDLFAKRPASEFGKNSEGELLDQINQFYTEEDQATYGVVGIKFTRDFKIVAKTIIVDENDNYLMMYRSNHPTFGNDADLPGGTHEDFESPEETATREVKEETGVDVSNLQELYSGFGYSLHGTYKSLFMAKLDLRPDIIMSWEHSSYKWLSKGEFLEESKNAKDSYMHMVYEVLNRQS